MPDCLCRNLVGRKPTTFLLQGTDSGRFVHGTWTGVVQAKNADIVQKLLAAHGVILGKTRMHELAYGVSRCHIHRALLGLLL